MRYIKINFGATKYFDLIILDRAAKFVDMIADIGGSIGLLIGFSMITAVETVYFAIKIIVGIINECIKRKNK